METSLKEKILLKFLCVIHVQHLTWKKYIQLIENKMSKNVDVFYKTNKVINSKCLRSIYFSSTHSCIVCLFVTLFFP